MKKLLRVVSIAVISVVLLYYVGVNGLLASPWGEALMNQRPELVQIHYTRAWTFVPLVVEVEGFQLSMQDRLVQISITADRVHGNLHPWTLRQQRFLATHVTGEGVTMHVRPRMTKGDPLEAHLAELPPIPGYETPVRDVSDNEVQASEIRFLSIDLRDLTVHHLRELWIDRVRYTGDAEVTGGMLYEPFRRLRIDDGHIVDAKSKLVAVAPHEVNIEALDARVTLAEVNMAALEFADLRGLVADVKMTATADADFLNSYLTHVSGLSTLSANGAPGQLELAVQVDHGVLANGGSLSYRSPRLAVRIPLVEVSGAAWVKGTVADERLALDVAITQAALVQRDGKHLVDAQRFGMAASSSADLTLLPDVDAVLSLQGGNVKTLTSLNQFIPEGAGVRLASGSGTIEGRLRIDSVPARASGEFAVTASEVTLENRSANITGKLQVHGEVRSLDLDTGAIDLSGSTIAIEDARLRAKGRTWSHLWLRAGADPCVLNPRGKVLWSSQISVASSNLQPLLAIVSENAPLPGVLDLFSDSPNVKVEATVLVRADSVELPRLVLTSRNVRAEGAMTLREQARDQRLEPWGGLVVHAGALSVGVLLAGPRVSVVLGDLERWATKHRITSAVRPAP